MRELLTEVMAIVMSAEEERRMRAAQRKSWVIGELMLRHPGMPREEAEDIYNGVLLNG